MITRRELLIAFAAGFAMPFTALAQGKVRRIGVLMETEPAEYATRLDGFKLGMRELGYVEGKDYVLEQRTGTSDVARLRALAAELIALKVDLILSTGSPSALAARDATREMPILITTAGDPVGSGLAASLRRPGGNVTGLTGLTSELVSKRLDLLRQIVPGLRRVGLLYDPDNANNALSYQQLQSDCARLRYTLMAAPVHKGEDLVAAFGIIQRGRVQGLIVSSPGWFQVSRASIIEMAAKHRLPAVYANGGLWPEAGALVSYTANVPGLYRRAAAYADKIFKGAKPGDLPIELPTKFELVINLKTAKALGLTIPPSVMVQATRVIE
jgi:putative ABC transport system substrate-binding protein